MGIRKNVEIGTFFFCCSTHPSITYYVPSVVQLRNRLQVFINNNFLQLQFLISKFIRIQFNFLK